MRYKIGTKWKCIEEVDTFIIGDEYIQQNESDTIENVNLVNMYGEGFWLGLFFKNRFVEVDEKEMRKRKIEGLCIILNNTVKELTELLKE